ncbi:hypothetical protein [Stutzerimonas xanthomarina]
MTLLLAPSREYFVAESSLDHLTIGRDAFATVTPEGFCGLRHQAELW